MLRRRLGGAGAVFVVPQLTGLATWGWLFRRLAALCTRDEPLSHSGPNGRLRCGREAAVPAEVADSAAHFTTQVHARTCRFTLDLRPSHLEVHARAGLSLRTMAAGDEPLELATCRRVVENHPVLAAAEPRLGRQPATRSPRRPRPEAPEARGALALVLALVYGGSLGSRVDLRPRGPPAVSPGASSKALPKTPVAPTPQERGRGARECCGAVRAANGGQADAVQVCRLRGAAGGGGDGPVC